MPNVMGRDFPYTPEGMTAAQQYSQAMGMRDGGPMGFRPISYANGGPVQGDPERSRVINALAEITGLPPENFSELSDDKLLEFARQVAQQQPQRVGKDFGDDRISNLDAATYQKLVAEQQRQPPQQLLEPPMRQMEPSTPMGPPMRNLGRIMGQMEPSTPMGPTMSFSDGVDAKRNLGRIMGQMEPSPPMEPTMSFSDGVDAKRNLGRIMGQMEPSPPMEPPMRNLGRITGRGGLMSLSPR